LKRVSAKATLILFSFVIFACVTVNIYFPAAAVGKAADQIVDEVWKEKNKDNGNTKKDEPEPDKKPEYSPVPKPTHESAVQNGIFFVILSLMPKEAYAEEAYINVSTPTIRALKESIKNRTPLIFPYLNKGKVGIGNNGFLVIRSQKNLSLREVARMKQLVRDENSDREALYKEIARANNISMDRVADIQAIFAKSWIKKARPGWFVQGSDGSWAKKK